MSRGPSSSGAVRARRPLPAIGSIRGERGATLVEVLIAILVFSVGVLGLASVLPVGMNRVSDSAGDTRASELASEACETLLDTPYDDTDMDSGTHNDPDNPHDGVYNIKWVVEVNQPIDSCKRVTVSVTRTNETNPRAKIVIVSEQAGGS